MKPFIPSIIRLLGNPPNYEYPVLDLTCKCGRKFKGRNVGSMCPACRAKVKRQQYVRRREAVKDF